MAGNGVAPAGWNPRGPEAEAKRRAGKSIAGNGQMCYDSAQRQTVAEKEVIITDE
jgi:hypothetical protein